MIEVFVFILCALVLMIIVIIIAYGIGIAKLFKNGKSLNVRVTTLESVTYGTTTLSDSGVVYVDIIDNSTPSANAYGVSGTLTSVTGTNINNCSNYFVDPSTGCGYTFNIPFETKFTSVPTVIPEITLVQQIGGVLTGVNIQANNITTKGFTLYIGINGNTITNSDGTVSQLQVQGMTAVWNAMSTTVSSGTK